MSKQPTFGRYAEIPLEERTVSFTLMADNVPAGAVGLKR
jgi:hypothetical protein